MSSFNKKPINQTLRPFADHSVYQNYRNLNKQNMRKYSKKLAYILRHGAEAQGLNMRTDGYVKLENLLRMKDFKHLNFQIIEQIVHQNDKQRFSMKPIEHHWFIRANQGHSIKSIKSDHLLHEIKMNEIHKYPVCCHGTYKKYWDSIKKEGLKTMKRNNIHFSTSDCYHNSNNCISGMRHNCELLIYIDMRSAMKDGLKFYLSENNVILSCGINGVLSPKYFKQVRAFKNGRPENKICFEMEEEINSMYTWSPSPSPPSILLRMKDKKSKKRNKE